MRTGEERPPAPGAAERVLYSDEHCLVVNKIAGESAEPLCGAGASTPAAGVSMPAGGQVDLPALLRDRFGPLTAVHRLDVPVSGCVLFARTARALSFLGAAFASGAPEGVEKRYWAITALPRGDLPETGELVHWIGRGGRGIDAGGKSIDAGGRGIDAGGGNKSVAFDEPGPGRKQGILRYRVRGRGDRYLFLEIDLVTGRHHQIRAQLARIGLPVKGDLKYGSPRSEKGGGIRLHGYSLSFPDPSGNGGTIRAEAPPPYRDALWNAFMGEAGTETLSGLNQVPPLQLL